MDFLINFNKDPKNSSSYKPPASTFDPLLQTISNLVSKLDKNELSEQDYSSLTSQEFYEKAFKDGLDSQCLSNIIENFAYENEGFSLMISITILKGLNKVMFDELRPYADGFSTLLNIKDSLQKKRMQWILGYPQPDVICNSNGVENFGLYGVNNLDDKTIIFPSILGVENSMSVLELMVYNISRVESVCLVCLKEILLLCTLQNEIFEYIFNLPTYCYLYAKFIDWFQPFLLKYQQEVSRSFFSDSRKKEICQEALRLLEIVMAEFKSKYPEQTEQCEQSNTVEIESNSNTTMEEAPILKGLNSKNHFIIGQTINENVKEIEKTEDFIFNCKDVSVITMFSKPTGKSNIALPRNIARESFLFPSCVDSGSVFSCFVHSKYAYSENYNRKTSKLSNLYNFFKTKILGVSSPEKETLTKPPPENTAESKPQIEKDKEEIEKEKEQKSSKENSMQSAKDFLNDLSEEFRVFDCIKKFTFENRSNKNILVSFFLRPGANSSSFTNIRPLYDQILILAKPYCTIDLLALLKVDFEKDWDPYEFDIKKYPVYSNSNIIKESLVFQQYIQQKKLDFDCVIIEDEKKTGSSGKNGEISGNLAKGIIRTGISGKKNVAFKFLHSLDENLEYDEG